MKQLKNYLMFLCRENGATILLHFTFAAVFIISGALIALAGYGLAAIILCSISMAVLIHGLVAVILIELFLTNAPSGDHWNMLELESGEIIPLDDVVPYRGRIIRIKKPKKFDSEKGTIIVKGEQVESNDVFDVVTKVIIEIKLNDEFDPIKLYHVLLQAQPGLASSGFLFEDFVLDRFNSYSGFGQDKEGNQSAGDVSPNTEKEKVSVSVSDYLKDTLQGINIPDDLFPGVEKVSIKLSGAKVFARKEKEF